MALKPRKILLALALAAAAAGTSVVSTAQAGTLAVNIAFKGASQRAVWQSIIDDFKKTHPGTDVKVSFVDEEAYKVQLPGWLSTVAPDIVNWHDGERMAYYAQRGLFEDLSGDWAKNGWNDMYASTKEASSYKGKQYAAPTVYYSWGMFYRKDLFQKVGISGEPKTWDQFLDDCKKLKAAGITPIAVAGRDSWTLAGWFDYLDLRLNGNAFHQKLMAGDIAYTDPRVKKVYTTWKQLIDAGYFIDNSLSYDLDAVQPFLFQGKAAMMLMGTFITAGFPPNVKPEMGYFQFPIIDANVPKTVRSNRCIFRRRRRTRRMRMPSSRSSRRRKMVRSWQPGSARCRRTASRLNRRIRFRRSASRFWRTRRAALRSFTIAT
jgi:multiple sugar transport system substrate-binding protein